MCKTEGDGMFVRASATDVYNPTGGAGVTGPTLANAYPAHQDSIGKVGNTYFYFITDQGPLCGDGTAEQAAYSLPESIVSKVQAN